MPKDKIFRGIIFVFVIVSAVLIWTKGNKFVVVENPDQQLKGQAYIDYWNDLNEEYKKDNYGGATPEETLNMFVGALKAGDLELASKYFVVEKQGIYLEAFRNWESNGSFNEVIGLIQRMEYSRLYATEDKNVRMIVRDTLQEPALLEMEFVKNSHTQKWKIYDL